jgi:hypothetical protein
LSISEPFSLDAISHPDRNRHALCTRIDLDAAFDIDSATWLRDGLGLPAMVVTQPDFEIYALAVHIGLVESAAFVRNINIIEAPAELAWAGPGRKLLMWVPDRRVPLERPAFGSSRSGIRAAYSRGRSFQAG